MQNRILSFDAANLFAPYFTLVADYARNGQWLLWNPWSNCGSPDIAYVELGSFSPITIFVGIITGGGDHGFLIYWLIIWTAGGIGMIMLGRHLGAPVWGALLIAVGYSFSGFYLGHATHTSWLYSLSFLPLMIWRLDLSLTRKRRWNALEAGALYGMSAMAGYPPIVILNGILLGLWSFGRWLTDATGSNGSSKSTIERMFAFRFMLFILAIVLLVGLVVLSPTYVAFFVEGNGYSERTGFLPRDIAVDEQALPIGAVATITNPYLSLLKINNQTLWPGIWFGLSCMYMGAFIPLMGIFALLHQRRNLWYWYLFGLSLLFLMCAVGSATPIRGWLYDVCPPTRYFRHSALFRAYSIFLIAVLGMIGTKSVNFWRRDYGGSYKLLTIIACVNSLAAIGVYLSVIRSVEEHGGSLPLANIHTAWAWLALPLVLAIAWKFRRQLGASYIVALLILHTLGDVTMSMVQFFTFTSDIREEVGLDEPHRNRLLDCGLTRIRYPYGQHPFNLNLYGKIPTIENYNTLNNRFHTRQGVGNAVWFNMDTNWSENHILSESVIGNETRFWFSPEAMQIDVTDACFYAFVMRSNQLGAIPLVIHSRESMLDQYSFGETAATDKLQTKGIATLKAAERIDINIIRYQPDVLQFEVNCPQDGWLLVTDRWAVGWDVVVNGNESPIFGGNFLFRAVSVKSGRNTLDFRYRPGGYPWLLCMSWGCLGFVGCGSVCRYWRRR